MNNKQKNKLVKENEFLKELVREGLKLAERFKRGRDYWKAMYEREVSK